MSEIDLPVLITHEGIRLPSRVYPGDAGLDLQAASVATIQPGERCVVETGVRVEIPHGYVGFILPRSGHAAKYGITHLDAPGVIDSEYRGELHFILYNSDKREAFKVNIGDRLGQLLVLRVAEATPVLASELSDTERGTRGLGSSR
ncbi:MAG TPA: dUTP diphosphatase [Solirubrobacteraceae bacterium]|jgi:dUTP pyrophosphatase